MDTLDDWEKKFIKGNDLEAEDLNEYLNGLSQFCELSKDGYVRLINGADKKLTKKDQIQLVVCARFVGNALQVKLGRANVISKTLEIDEIASILRIDKSIVSARISDLKKEKKVLDISKGVYEATIFSIKPFIAELNKKSTKGV